MWIKSGPTLLPFRTLASKTGLMSHILSHCAFRKGEARRTFAPTVTHYSVLLQVSLRHETKKMPVKMVFNRRNYQIFLRLSKPSLPSETHLHAESLLARRGLCSHQNARPGRGLVRGSDPRVYQETSQDHIQCSSRSGPP